MAQLCTPEDIEFAETCFETLYQTYARHPHALKLEAKEPPYDPEDAGVPPAMADGKPGKDGYVRWKLLPAGLDEQRLTELEAEYGIAFPALYRACLLARRQLFEHVGPVRDGIEWIPSPSDNPLGPLRELLSSWRPLAAVGFVPFAMMPEGIGPICFDTRKASANGDCPIVTFDHEVLFELEQDGALPPASTAGAANPFFDSLRSLMTEFFKSKTQS